MGNVGISDILNFNSKTKDNSESVTDELSLLEKKKQLLELEIELASKSKKAS